MRKSFIATFVGLCVLTLVSLSVTPAAASVWWLPYSENSTRLCMDVTGGSTADGALLQEFTCNQSAAQLFQIVGLADGNAYVIPQSSNKCVEIWNNSLNDGAPVEQLTCLGRFGQEWQVPIVRERPNGSVDVMFRNALSQKCITGTGNGVVLYQQTCNSSNPHQVWHQLLREGCPTCVPALRPN
jgi:hypothetical protein